MKHTRAGSSLLGTCDSRHILIHLQLSAIHFIRNSINPSLISGTS